MIEEEAVNFMKFKKEIEYKVIDQLHKIPTQISLLFIILSSKPHCRTLMNMLKKELVSKEISADEMGNVTASIFSNKISLGEDDLGD